MRRHALALTAAAVLVVGAPTAASAQTWNHTDPVGDVTKYTWNLDTDEETEVVDPTITNGDVISSTVKHNPRKVIATMRFRDLVAPTEDIDLFVMSVRTGKLNRDLAVAATPDDVRGQHRLSRTNGDDVRCRGLSHRIDYTANTVTMSVPRACLGRPSRISAGVGAVRTNLASLTNAMDDPDPSTPAIIEQYLDDAHSSGVGDDLVFSPRLRRG